LDCNCWYDCLWTEITSFDFTYFSTISFLWYKFDFCCYNKIPDRELIKKIVQLNGRVLI
jgi:hypothetical protein